MRRESFEMDRSEVDTQLDCVELDALVILRIMKHCRSALPQQATGQLLGMDVDNVLQISNCFEYPQQFAEADHGHSQKHEQYQLDMLKMLREVNIDNNTVGWYESISQGGFVNDRLIETQYEYQEAIPKSVVLIFDPLQSAAGKVAFKAYRLKTSFFNKMKAGKAMGDMGRLSGLQSHEVLEEIPIKINNPLLVEAYLVEWAMGDPKAMDVQFECLDLENQTFLEKNVQFLLECLDDLAKEQSNLQYFERRAIAQQKQQQMFADRRKLENDQRRARGEELLAEVDGPGFKRAQMPSQLETVLISKQIQNYCKQINTYASDSFGKLFLVGGMHKPTATA